MVWAELTTKHLKNLFFMVCVRLDRMIWPCGRQWPSEVLLTKVTWKKSTILGSEDIKRMAEWPNGRMAGFLAMVCSCLFHVFDLFVDLAFSFRIFLVLFSIWLSSINFYVFFWFFYSLLFFYQMLTWGDARSWMQSKLQDARRVQLDRADASSLCRTWGVGAKVQ